MESNRIEKKFVLGKFKKDYLSKFLISNGFTKQYPERKISSIYLDTNNYDFARDNINGVSQRKKIRFRWYNDDDTQIFIEEKNKNNVKATLQLAEKYGARISLQTHKIIGIE